MRKKAIVAIAIASGTVNPQLPVSAKEPIESQPVLITDYVRSTYVSPEIRAYFLLLIANWCLDGRKKSEVEKLFGPVDTVLSSSPFKIRGRDIFPIQWLQLLSTKAHEKHLDATGGKTRKPEKPGKEELDLARKATKEAYQLLKESGSDEYRLELLYVASCMQRRLGNIKEAETYTQTIDRELLSYEAAKSVRIDRAQSAVNVLNAKSNIIIPVQIPDYKITAKPNIKPFSTEEFKASEALRLRAVAIADKTPSTEHVRRKAHRDMALWYQMLGKEKLAEEQKHALFQLVGFKNDNALYPNHKGCGQIEWWQEKVSVSTFDCGMG